MTLPEPGQRIRVRHYALRVLPSWPYHRSHVGDVVTVGRNATREDAERVRQAMPNGAHMEVVEVDDSGEVVG